MEASVLSDGVGMKQSQLVVKVPFRGVVVLLGTRNEMERDHGPQHLHVLICRSPIGSFKNNNNNNRPSAEAVAPINSPVETTRISSQLVGVLLCLARLDLVAVKSLCNISKANFRFSGIFPSVAEMQNRGTT